KGKRVDAPGAVPVLLTLTTDITLASEIIRIRDVMTGTAGGMKVESSVVLHHEARRRVHVVSGSRGAPRRLCRRPFQSWRPENWGPAAVLQEPAGRRAGDDRKSSRSGGQEAGRTPGTGPQRRNDTSCRRRPAAGTGREPGRIAGRARTPGRSGAGRSGGARRAGSARGGTWRLYAGFTLRRLAVHLGADRVGSAHRDIRQRRLDRSADAARAGQRTRHSR